MFGYDGNPFMHFIGFIVTGLFTLFAVLIVAALLFVLVRFLLIATKAAQIYVAKNSPAKPVMSAAPAPAPAPAPANLATSKPAANSATAKPAARKPATKPAVTKPSVNKPVSASRTPKTPPTAPTA